MLKRPTIIFIFTLCVFLILPALSYAIHVKVVRVYDGDTIKAVCHDIEIKVRLIGIDAPETSRKKHQPGQPYSDKAKERLASLVLNKYVEIKGYGLGPYNRILGVVFIDGQNVNLEMLRAGLAEVYRGKPPHGFNLNTYKQTELEARDSGRGIWSQGDDYISPRKWRKSQKR